MNGADCTHGRPPPTRSGARRRCPGARVLGVGLVSTLLLACAAPQAREADPLSDVRARNRQRELKRETYDARQRAEGSRRDEARLQTQRALPDRDGRTLEQRQREIARARDDVTVQRRAVERSEGAVRGAERDARVEQAEETDEIGDE